MILATTTSTRDSGLLDVLVPGFERETGYPVKTIAVGSGEAIEMGSRGEADVVLAHSPAAEEELMAAGKGPGAADRDAQRLRRSRPRRGPGRGEGRERRGRVVADRRGAVTVHLSRRRFGHAHVRVAMWKDAGLTPEGGWYQESGQGMGATLQIANDKAAYTLSDRGTYLATKSGRDLEILVEGGADLLNVYHVIDVAPEAGEHVNAAGGKAFADWLVSPPAQREIETFGAKVRRAAVRAGRR